MYKREGMEMFETLKERIQYDIVHTIYRVVAGPSATNGSEGQAKKRPEAKSIMAKALGNRPSAPEASGSTKVGRNDTCPCGSGKKYKKCHGTS